MTPAEIRWRCERMEVLLQVMGRKEAVEEVEGEALERPWEQDPRPAPAPMPRGYIHTKEHELRRYQNLDSTCGSYVGSDAPWGYV